MRDFRKLIAWQKAHGLAIRSHQSLGARKGLGTAATRNQLLRSMASIPANIAEGCGKRTDSEFARYLDIALGSAKESENHLIFARDMGWLDDIEFEVLNADLTEVRRILFALANSMRVRIETRVHREGREPEASSDEP
jgi:four helix bundle protein